jgi:hypothetical protein
MVLDSRFAIQEFGHCHMAHHLLLPVCFTCMLLCFCFVHEALWLCKELRTEM